jgi:NDP-4-keto-2,6-dideoxyhexose 3-C-methyltransferase
MMRTALADVVADVTARVQLAPGDVVLDIGANDGTMLLMFPELCRRIGVDPASNIRWDHVGTQATMINDFFTPAAVNQATSGQKCRVVTTIAMLYNMANLDAVVADIAAILAPDGVWCIQLSYLPALLETMSFYDVCHEHLYYFSVSTLKALLERHGLCIFDASTNEVNGGSLRAFVAHRDTAPPPSAALAELSAREAKLGLDDPATYAGFFDRVERMRAQVTSYLEKRRTEGQLVVGLGASTKGNVLLQFFGIDNSLLPYISERNPEKVGLRTLGTDIEIVSEERARELAPSDMLVLIWFFKDELLRRERSYLEAGGRLLFPMPTPYLVTRDGEQPLD